MFDRWTSQRICTSLSLKKISENQFLKRCAAENFSLGSYSYKKKYGNRFGILNLADCCEVLYENMCKLRNVSPSIRIRSKFRNKKNTKENSTFTVNAAFGAASDRST